MKKRFFQVLDELNQHDANNNGTAYSTSALSETP